MKNIKIILLIIIPASAILIGILIAAYMSISDAFSEEENSKTDVAFSLNDDIKKIEDPISTLEDKEKIYHAAKRQLKKQEEKLKDISFAGAFAPTPEKKKEEETKTGDNNVTTAFTASADKSIIQSTKSKKTGSSQKQESKPPIPEEKKVTIENNNAPMRISRTRTSQESTEDEANTPINSPQLQFKATVFEDTKIEQEGPVRLRILETFQVNNCSIKRNTIIAGRAQVSQNKIKIIINQIAACSQIITCDYSGYKDGIEGLTFATRPTDEATDAASSSARQEVGNEIESATRAGGILGRAIGVGAKVLMSSEKTNRQQTILIQEGTTLIFM